MLQSMTGFGKSEAKTKKAQYFIDIKSLNSKYIDINLRLPSDLKYKELDIRKVISDTLQRGKVDATITCVQTGEEPVQVNSNLINAYIEAFQNTDEQISTDAAFTATLRLPDVLLNQQEELSETEWSIFLTGLSNALSRLNNYRTNEGAVLKEDVENRVIHILELLKEIEKFEPQRMETLKQRIKKSLEEFDNVDENRFEQELIYYLEKLDITEEKVRLKNHCDYFLEVLNEPQSNGKKLNFISQEMGREINTLGSKSNQSDMQRIVVDMKDELEKIKEQVLNVL